MSIRVKSKVMTEIVEQAMREAPLECCGLMGGRADLITTVYPIRNVAVNPEVRYEAAPQDLFQATRQIRVNGEEFVGIYHSHPRSAAYPSPTDVELAFYSEAVYFIVSLASGRTIVNAFRICEGEISPVEYDVVMEQCA